MSSLPKLIAAALLLLPCTVLAQESLEIEASGEYRLTTGDTAESARQLAAADARRRAVVAVANALTTRGDVTEVKLTALELNAFLFALIEFDEARVVLTEPADASTMRVSMRAQFDGNAAQRLSNLRKDEDASRTIVANFGDRSLSQFSIVAYGFETEHTHFSGRDWFTTSQLYRAR